MGTMNDVDHSAWNSHPLLICNKTLDPMKHCNIDPTKQCGDPRVNLKLKYHISKHVQPMGMVGPIASALKTHHFFKTNMINYAWVKN